MSGTRTRRAPVKRAPGSALLTQGSSALSPRPEPFKLERREGVPAAAEEKTEVVVEPSLPTTGPAPSPAAPPAPPELTPEQAEEQAYAEAEAREVVAYLNLTPAEQAAALYYAAVAAMPPGETRWKAGIRAPRLKVGAYTLQPGEIVPGADGWLRRESWERSGRIERA